MTDAEVKHVLAASDVVALTLYGEARGEPIEGKVAVGCVIRNRVQTPRRFGATYAAVCLARLQFSCWWQAGGAANYDHVMSLARTLAMGGAVTGNDLFAECRYLAEGIRSDVIRDRVAHANHYYSPAAMVPRNRVPDWAIGRDPVAVVNAHRFFKL